MRSALWMLLVFAPAALAGAAQSTPAQPAAPQGSQDAAAQSSRSKVRLGGVFVGAGYLRRPFFDPYWGYARWYYDPVFFWPLYAPGYYYGFGWQADRGAVKLQAANKDAWVYLDGGLAGRADKLKEMWLDPGVYNLEVREPSRTLSQKIYVLSGKTLKLTPEMMEVRQ